MNESYNSTSIFPHLHLFTRKDQSQPSSFKCRLLGCCRIARLRSTLILILMIITCITLVSIPILLFWGENDASILNRLGHQSIRSRFHKTRATVEIIPTDNMVDIVMNSPLYMHPHLILDTNLTVIVHSAITNFERRRAIRETWGHALRSRGHQVFFITGSIERMPREIVRRIHDEHSHHDDMIEYDFIDTYANLTLKALFAIRFFNEKVLELETRAEKVNSSAFVEEDEYVKSEEPSNQTRYLLKMDDDNVLSPERLNRWRDYFSAKFNSQETAEIDFFHKSVIGYAYYNAKPVRNPRHKHFVPRKIYPHQIYPNYLAGGGYMMTEDVARSLLITCLIEKRCQFFPMDDIFITGFLLSGAVELIDYYTYFADKFMGPRLFHHSGFDNYPISALHQVCDLIKQPHNIKFGNNLSPRLMREIWKLLIDGARRESICRKSKGFSKKRYKKRLG